MHIKKLFKCDLLPSDDQELWPPPQTVCSLPDRRVSPPKECAISTPMAKLPRCGRFSLVTKTRAQTTIKTFWSICCAKRVASVSWTWHVARGKTMRKDDPPLANILNIFLFSRVDSIMLLEEGFEVVSVDASDKMLKYALKERWNRRKEDAFDNWSKWMPLVSWVNDSSCNSHSFLQPSKRPIGWHFTMTFKIRSRLASMPSFAWATRSLI